MAKLYNPSENVKKDSRVLEKELTLLPYQVRQHTGIPSRFGNACRLKCIRSEGMWAAGYGELVALFLSDTGKSIDNV